MVTLGPYIKLLHGYSPEHLTVGDGYTEYEYQGRKIKSPPDGTGSFFEVFHEHVYDQWVTPVKGDVVFDVGAYVGMWSVRAAVAVGEKGRVFAVEPSPENQRWLNDNVTGLPVTVLPYLASNRSGTETLYMAKQGSCNSTVLKNGQAVEMECHNIDWIAWKYQIDAVDFIKIDAEGAELKVLEGAWRILRRGTKLAIASYHDLPDGTPEYPQIVKFLARLGYEIETESGLRRYIYARKERVGKGHQFDE